MIFSVILGLKLREFRQSLGMWEYLLWFERACFHERGAFFSGLTGNEVFTYMLMLQLAADVWREVADWDVRNWLDLEPWKGLQLCSLWGIEGQRHHSLTEFNHMKCRKLKVFFSLRLSHIHTKHWVTGASSCHHILWWQTMCVNEHECISGVYMVMKHQSKKTNCIFGCTIYGLQSSA